MTNLTINPVLAINTILLFVSIVSFIFAYQKRIKNRVEKSDLVDLKTYVDQQDRSIHHRVDEVNHQVNKVEDAINKKLDIIIAQLISKK